MTQAIIPHSDQELAGPEAIFDKAVAIVLDTLSPTSRRVYHQTYRAWCQFATEHGFDVMALTLDNIRGFIHEADVAKTTRQNRLSHMRKLLELPAIGDDYYRQNYNAVKSFQRVQANEGDRSRAERVKRALNPHEATALLGVWRNDTSHVGIRNDVMIRLLVYTGLRRSELIALRWSDINVENLTITVRHGKGDRERVVALVDPSEGTTTAPKCAGQQLHLSLPIDDARAQGDLGSRYPDGGSDGDAGCRADCTTSRSRGARATRSAADARRRCQQVDSPREKTLAKRRHMPWWSKCQQDL